MKYRIKSRQTFMVGLDNSGESVNYRVQAKFDNFPIWFTVTRSFNSLSKAEEYIDLILNEFERVENHVENKTNK